MGQGEVLVTLNFFPLNSLPSELSLFPIIFYVSYFQHWFHPQDIRIFFLIQDVWCVVAISHHFLDLWSNLRHIIFQLSSPR